MKLYNRRGGILMIIALLTAVTCSGDKMESNVQAAEHNVNSSEYNDSYDFTTEKLDGSPLRLSDYKGKVVIINLWDTWCPPCRLEIPDFIELYAQYQKQGFVMVGLAFGQEGRQAVEKFVQDNGVNYVNGFVNQDVIARFGQPRGIPTTYVIDQNGNVYKKYVGYTEKSVFETDIKALLNI
ncbi:TlpA family protein disulfide reductase [candidate division KSB1 bacterium]|nr:TlpA family protein disulfide reductase [candidate division KSB1 bacterium]